MAELHYDLSNFEIDYSNFPIDNYGRLMGYARYGDEEPIIAEFGVDLVSPHYDHPVRINKIQLIKGTAIQHSPPARTLRVIDIVGWCRTPEDRNKIQRLFYVNYPELPAPYPTEFLKIRRDYYKLLLPDGADYTVRFANTPTFTPAQGQQGRYIYSLAVRFYPVIANDEVDY